MPKTLVSGLLPVGMYCWYIYKCSFQVNRKHELQTVDEILYMKSWLASLSIRNYWNKTAVLCTQYGVTGPVTEGDCSKSIAF